MVPQSECIRTGLFEETEKHKCFVKGCDAVCYPHKSETCKVLRMVIVLVIYQKNQDML